MENQIENNVFSDDKISTAGIKQESSFTRALRKNRVLLMMLIPAFLYFFIFSYLPMSGAIVAFKSYNFREGIFGSPWVGFSNFEYFFKSGQAWTVTRNTILYNVGFIVVNTVLQMGLAIFISEIGGKYFKKVTQTAMFLPYFISWVVVGMIAYNFLNVDYGTVNTILNKLGMESINFYGTKWVWPIIITAFCAWKNVGYGTVLYLAAIMGIDQEIYEAAQIDGANIFQRIFKVTIPCLVPTLIILTLSPKSSHHSLAWVLFPTPLLAKNAIPQPLKSITTPCSKNPLYSGRISAILRYTARLSRYPLSE